jgi:DNA-binding NarL/FixJ family response regulator
MSAGGKARRATPAPAGIETYRIALDAPPAEGAEELVLFVWESARVSAPLTTAEREVLGLVLEGHSNAKIAALRGTSVRTVANQVASLLRALGARSRFELIGRLGRGVRPSEKPPRQTQ